MVALRILFGVFLIVLALYSVVVGKAHGRGHTWKRMNEPLWFWIIITIQFAVGILALHG